MDEFLLRCVLGLLAVFYILLMAVIIKWIREALTLKQCLETIWTLFWIGCGLGLVYSLGWGVESVLMTYYKLSWFVG